MGWIAGTNPIIVIEQLFKSMIEAVNIFLYCQIDLQVGRREGEGIQEILNKRDVGGGGFAD